MNDALKIFTSDLAKELKAKLQGQDTAEFIDKVKASGDDRTFEVVMSTSDEDRQGDALDQSNWDLKYFDMNPVVLWAHNYQGFPIGVVTDIVIEGDKAIATGKFAPEGDQSRSRHGVRALPGEDPPRRLSRIHPERRRHPRTP